MIALATAEQVAAAVLQLLRPACAEIATVVGDARFPHSGAEIWYNYLLQMKRPGGAGNAPGLAPERRRFVMLPQSILPAPVLQTIDPGFGHWFAGLIDGEGYFTGYARERSGVFRADVAFGVGMRADNEPMLRLCAETLGVGAVSITRYKTRSSMSRYDVYRLDDLRDVIVPFFRRFRLRSRKGEQVEVFAELVELVHQEQQARWRSVVRDAKGRYLGTAQNWDRGGQWPRACALADELARLKQWEE